MTPITWLRHTAALDSHNAPAEMFELAPKSKQCFAQRNVDARVQIVRAASRKDGVRCRAQVHTNRARCRQAGHLVTGVRQVHHVPLGHASRNGNTDGGIALHLNFLSAAARALFGDVHPNAAALWALLSNLLHKAGHELNGADNVAFA